MYKVKRKAPDPKAVGGGGGAGGVRKVRATLVFTTKEYKCRKSFVLRLQTFSSSCPLKVSALWTALQS